jgi:hypothetical protein
MLLQFLMSEVLWAAVIAAVLALGGVLLTNKHSRSLQATALKHEATQRDREREMALRRDVYLKSVEAVYSIYTGVMRLADLRTEESEITSSYMSHAQSIVGVFVIGSNKTVVALNALMQEVAAAYLELTLKRWPLTERRSRVAELNTKTSESLSRDGRHVGLLEDAHLAGQPTEALARTVDALMVHEAALRSEYEQERSAITCDQYSEEIHFLEACIQRYVAVSALVPPALFSVRAEMDLPIDEEAFIADFNANAERSVAMLEGYLAEARAKLESE